MAKKIVIGFLLLVLAGGGGGVYYFLHHLDRMVQAAVEKYGSEATGTTVRLEKATIKISDGEGILEGLSVGNPPGFSNQEAVYVGGIDVNIDPSKLTKDGPVIITEVDVDKPAISYEVNADGKNNLKALQRRASSEEARESDPGKQPRKVIINDLYIRNGAVQVSHPLLKGRTLQAALPTIHLRDVGKKAGGATEKEVARQIVAAVTASAMSAATNAAKDELGSAFKAYAGAAADQAMGMASDAAGSVVDNVSNSISSKIPSLPSFGGQ